MVQHRFVTFLEIFLKLGGEEKTSLNIFVAIQWKIFVDAWNFTEYFYLHILDVVQFLKYSGHFFSFFWVINKLFEIFGFFLCK